MELKALLTHQSLITEVSEELITLANFLGIPTHISMEDDHVFILGNGGELSIYSFLTRRITDVVIPTELFCEILMDIKSGMTVIDAYNRRGYTF